MFSVNVCGRVRCEKKYFLEGLGVYVVLQCLLQSVAMCCSQLGRVCGKCSACRVWCSEWCSVCCILLQCVLHCVLQFAVQCVVQCVLQCVLQCVFCSVCCNVCCSVRYSVCCSVCCRVCCTHINLCVSGQQVCVALCCNVGCSVCRIVLHTSKTVACLGTTSMCVALCCNAGRSVALCCIQVKLVCVTGQQVRDALCCNMCCSTRCIMLRTYVPVKVVCVTGPQVCVLHCVAMRVAVCFALLLCCIQVKLVCVTGQTVFPRGPRHVFSFVHVGCRMFVLVYFNYVGLQRAIRRELISCDALRGALCGSVAVCCSVLQCVLQRVAQSGRTCVCVEATRILSGTSLRT